MTFNKMTETNKIFKERGAVKLIYWVFDDLPQITIIISTLIRLAIGIILFFHVSALFSFIKLEFFRYGIVAILAFGLEAAFLASSLVSAKLRRVGMKNWAWAFLVFTIIGSLAFNGFFIAHATRKPNNLFLGKVDDQFWVLIFLEFSNLVGIIMAEAAAFLLEDGDTQKAMKAELDRVKRKLEKAESKPVTSITDKPKTEPTVLKSDLETQLNRALEQAVATSESGEFYLSAGKNLISWKLAELPDLMPVSSYDRIVGELEKEAKRYFPTFTVLPLTPSGSASIATKAETSHHFSVTEATDLEQRVGELTPDVLKMLKMVSEGLKQKSMAEALGVSEKTIRNWMVKAAQNLGYLSAKALKKDIGKIVPLAKQKLEAHETSTV